jgi:hypothetical protein
MPKKTGYGIQVAYGGAWASGSCRMVWEFIRCYMEEGGDTLPATEVTPAGLNPVWVDTLLDSGPYHEVTEGNNRQELRRINQGKPQIKWWVHLFMFTIGPGVLINLWQMFVRPKVKLPAEWVNPVAVQTTAQQPTYKTIRPDPQDIALRHKEARWVAVWLGLCAVGGTAFWVAVAYGVTRL